MLIPSCEEPMEKRPIQAEEIGESQGLYQAGSDMCHNNQVDLPSPRSEPGLSWIKTGEELEMDPFTEVMVDREGGVWYRSSNAYELIGLGLNSIDSETLGSFVYQPSIVRLDSFGDKFFDRKFNLTNEGNLDVPFLGVLTDSAMILSVAYMEPGFEEVEESWRTYLMCIDINGVARWQTDPIKNDRFRAGVWRTDFDRVLMSAPEHEFLVYEIFDGEQTGSFEVSGIMESDDIGPIPMFGDAVLVHGLHHYSDMEFIEVRDFNGNGQSFLNLEHMEHTISPVRDDSMNVYYGSPSGLSKIDMGQADITWTRYQGNRIETCGLTPYGNVLAMRYGRSGPEALLLVDPDGAEIWSKELDPENAPFHTVIYMDNTVLLSHATGISLLSQDGTTRWTVTPSEMDFDSGTRFRFLESHPVVFDGIFVHYQVEHSDRSLDEGLIRLQVEDPTI